MRVNQLQGSRPDYYDRAAINQSLLYTAAGIGPHAATIRWTYTVPAGSRAFVDVISENIIRDGVAGVVGVQSLYLLYTPSGGGTIIIYPIHLYNNALYSEVWSHVTGFGALLAGDAISQVTLDLSTGGTGNYNGSAKIFEFQA